MFAPVALVVIAACCRPTYAHAHAHNATRFPDVLERTLSFVFGEQDTRWPRKIASCARNLGPSKCINAFSVWRADNAIDSFEKYGGCRSVITDDLNEFPWEKYVNTSVGDLDSNLSDRAAKLLQLRSLKFTMLPGYQFHLGVKDNGALNVDVYKDDEQEKGEARGALKKLRKRFYAIVPLLLLPGLIMAAILPFVLPALKMSVIGVGMLNQMALSGAIFTILRNNAFNDYYEKRIIYKNKGYKNEKRHKRPPIHIEEEIHSHTVDYGPYDDGWKNAEITEYAGTNDFANIEEEGPTNEGWIHQYYGGEGFDQVIAPETRIVLDKRKKTRKKNHLYSSEYE